MTTHIPRFITIHHRNPVATDKSKETHEPRLWKGYSPLMSRKRAHNRRVVAASGSSRRFADPGRPPATSRKKRPKKPKTQQRCRSLSTADAIHVLRVYRDLHPDFVFEPGSRVIHPRSGYLRVLGVDVKGSGGWDKLDYRLQPERGGRILRTSVQGAHGRGIRAVTEDHNRFPSRARDRAA